MLAAITNNRQIFQAVDVWNTIPPADTSGMYVYNTKAHPALSTEKELIITYNVNGGDEDNADIYRPRFIRYGQVPLAPEN